MPRKSGWQQGTFKPNFPQKIIGSPTPRYLSSYELKFLRFADKNPNVIKYGSENIQIPYFNPFDKKVHRYMVDFFVVLKDKDGKLVKYLVELKPHKQTLPPSTKKTRKNKKSVIYEQVMYVLNQQKWNAAKKWSEKNNCKFLVLTEKHLQIK